MTIPSSGVDLTTDLLQHGFRLQGLGWPTRCEYRQVRDRRATDERRGSKAGTASALGGSGTFVPMSPAVQRAEEGNEAAGACGRRRQALGPRLARSLWSMRLAGLATVFVAFSAGQAHGQSPGPRASFKWAIDDANPASNIPTEREKNEDPLEFGYWLQAVAVRAEAASKRGDHSAAAGYYDALGRAAPDRAVGFMKACEEYEAAGDIEKAIDRCVGALSRDGLRLGDSARAIDVVLRKQGPLGARETAAISEALARVKNDPAGSSLFDDLECRVASRTLDIARLRECTSALVARAPNDARTISYEWALAVAEGNTQQAGRLVQRAEAEGAAPDEVRRMKEETSARSKRGWSIAAVVGVGLALVFVVVGAARRRQRRDWIRRSRP